MSETQTLFEGEPLTEREARLARFAYQLAANRLMGHSRDLLPVGVDELFRASHPDLPSPQPETTPSRARFHVGHVMALSMVISEAALAPPTGDAKAEADMQNALARAHEVLWYMQRVFGTVERFADAAKPSLSETPAGPPVDEYERLHRQKLEIIEKHDFWKRMAGKARTENESLRARLSTLETAAREYFVAFDARTAAYRGGTTMEKWATLNEAYDAALTALRSLLGDDQLVQGQKPNDNEG